MYRNLNASVFLKTMSLEASVLKERLVLKLFFIDNELLSSFSEKKLLIGPSATVDVLHMSVMCDICTSKFSVFRLSRNSAEINIFYPDFRTQNNWLLLYT